MAYARRKFFKNLLIRTILRDYEEKSVNKIFYDNDR